MECVREMSLKQMIEIYPDNTKFIVVDVNKGVSNPQKMLDTPVQTTGTQTYGEIDTPADATRDHKSVQTGEVDVDEEMKCMNDYYKNGDYVTTEHVVVLEEKEGVIIYSGKGTQEDPVVIDWC